MVASKQEWVTYCSFNDFHILLMCICFIQDQETERVRLIVVMPLHVPSFVQQ
jgi:hypothetical protein